MRNQLLGIRFGPAMVDLFDKLGFFRIFSAVWFVALLVVLVVAIICCTLDRTPRLWRSVQPGIIDQPLPFFDLALPERALLEHTGAGRRMTSPRCSDAGTSRSVGRRPTTAAPCGSRATATSTSS